jgi:transcription elongation factor SPT5
VPALFDYAKLTTTFGEKAVIRRNHGYIYRNEWYTSGYLELIAPASKLVQEVVHPTSQELASFVLLPLPGSTHRNPNTIDLRKIAMELILSTSTSFRVGDRVQVISGQQTGLSGYVQSVDNDSLAILPHSDNDNADVISFSPKYLKKLFEIGDFVKVRTGLCTGRKGWVVDIDDNIVTITERENELVDEVCFPFFFFFSFFNLTAS